MILKTLTCINCGQIIKDPNYISRKAKAGLTYYAKTDNVGPTYFIAHTVKGPEYYFPDLDLPLCGPECGVEYDKTENT